ncbi:hypothetical protein OSB04_024720 [Centaurea solstitialis]|uniref:Reverse transcriptase domain-containing protein n=1 Tax=Centaurea solstitialis TaxID=347529 RepID=A0AA38SU65_9ASTR|nr:hypothetical protein OSB04_024720 [Centaurea solstitialis]
MQVVEPEVELPSRPTKEVSQTKGICNTTCAYTSAIPTRLRKEKKETQYRKFIDLIKRVDINVPLVDLIAGVPSYARFLKELVTNNARMGTEEIAFLNAEYSATLSDTLKKGDPGSFIIPCYFGKSVSCRALADLGASINLMLLSFYQKLGLKDLKSTRMTIQLANRSIKYPVGVPEDVIDEVKVPLILGRPFLNTASAVIHVAERELSLGIGEDRITLSIDGIPNYNESINTLDGLDDFTEPFESEPNDHLFESGELEESLAVEKRWDETAEEEEEDFEELKQEDKVRVKTSLEEPPDLELKDLPEHLEYQFLEGNNSLPVIISSLLTANEKDRLIEVLKRHKKALAWKISDIPGISPSFCTHKILMEDNFKPCVQKQGRLNPKMQEVVKKEVIKLLDTGIIYPISDSPWVSPVQVVPKKGRLTVLVPTRTVTGWRVCIDYRKLNDATRKDHFPLPFIDQMLERLAGNEYYCFLDGFSGYIQIPIDPEDQEKTTFTCPFGTFCWELQTKLNMHSGIKQNSQSRRSIPNRFRYIFKGRLCQWICYILIRRNLAYSHVSSFDDLSDEVKLPKYMSRLMMLSRLILATTLRSVIKFLSQTASFAASEAAMYSASVVESAIVSCFELFHEIAPPFRVKTYPDCDL